MVLFRTLRQEIDFVCMGQRAWILTECTALEPKLLNTWSLFLRSQFWGSAFRFCHVILTSTTNQWWCIDKCRKIMNICSHEQPASDKTVSDHPLAVNTAVLRKTLTCGWHLSQPPAEFRLRIEGTVSSPSWCHHSISLRGYNYLWRLAALYC